MKRAIKLFFNSLIIVIILNLFTMLNVFADSVDLTASMDTYVNQASGPQFEQGGDTILNNRNFTNKMIYSFLQFDLSSIPQDATVTSAYLELTQSTTTTTYSDSYILRKVADNHTWTLESGNKNYTPTSPNPGYLIWNNYNTLVPLDATSDWNTDIQNDSGYNGKTAGSKIRFDFSGDTLLSRLKSGTYNDIVFRISQSTSLDAYSAFASKENTTVTYRPKLYIEYAQTITPVLDGVVDTNKVEIGEIKINFHNSNFTTNQITQGNVVVKENGTTEVSSTGFSFIPTYGSTPANIRLTITDMKPSTLYTISFANTLKDDSGKVIGPLSFVTKDKEIKITGIDFINEDNSENLTQIKAGDIKTTVNVKNESLVSQTFVAVLVLYNNNEMSEYKVSQPITLTYNQTESIVFDNVSVSDENNEYLRVFLWDGEATMVPLANPWQLSSSKDEITQ